MPAPSDLFGIKFPFQPGMNSSPETVEGINVLVSDVQSLLFTALGEMPMLEDVGTNIHSFVFETPSEITQALISQEIRSLIKKNVPQMIVDAVITEVQEVNGAPLILVRVIYSVNGEGGEIPIPLV